MAGDVRVKLSADVSDFVAGTEASTEGVEKLDAAMSETAAAAAKISASTTEAAGALSVHNETLTAAHAAHSQLGGVLSQNRAAFMEISHSVRAVADGMIAGISPTRILAMELPRVAQAFMEMNPAIIGTALGIAGVVAVAGGLSATLVMLVTHAESVDRALGTIQVAMEASGRGADYSREGIVNLIEQFRSLEGVSTKQAESMIGDLARQRTIGVGSYLALGTAAAGMARVTGEDTPQALEKMVRALDGGFEGIRKLDEQFDFLNPTQQESIRAFSEHGDKAGVLGVAIEALKDKFGPLIDQGLTRTEVATNSLGVAWDHLMHSFDQSDAVNSAREKIAKFMEDLSHGLDPTSLDALQAKLKELEASRDHASKNIGFFGMSQEEVDLLDRDIAKVKELIAAKQQSQAPAASGAGIGDDPAVKLKNALNVARELRAEELRGEEIHQRIKQLQDAENGATAEQTTQLQAGIRALQLQEQALKDRGGQNQLSQWKDELDKRLEGEHKYGEAAKAEEVSFWQGKLDQVAKGSQAELQIRRTLYDLEGALATESAANAKRNLDDAWQNYSDGIKRKIQAATGNFALQAQLADQWEKHGEEIYNNDTHKFSEASDEKIRIAKEAAAAQRKIQEQTAEDARLRQEGDAARAKITDKPTKLQKGDLGIGDLIDGDGLQSQIDQETQKITGAYQQGQSELLDAMSGEQDQNKFTALFEKYKTAQVQYSADIKAAHDQAAQSVQNAWEGVLSPIEHGLSSSIQGVMQGTQTIEQAFQRAGQSIVLSFVDQGIQGLTRLAAKQLAQVTLTETTEAAKTAATDAGVASRTAAEAAGSNGFFGTIGTTLARWLGLETEKTAATVAGEGARTAVVVTGAETEKTVTATTAQSGIMAHAAKAAAGAYDALAGIPIIGPVLGAAAAVATFAAVAAYGSIASAEGGLGSVPFDGFPAELHREEMVLPASIASPLRSALAGGGKNWGMPGLSGPALPSSSSTANDNSKTWHLHYGPQITNGSPVSMERLLREQGSALLGFLKNAHGNGAFR